MKYYTDLQEKALALLGDLSPEYRANNLKELIPSDKVYRDNNIEQALEEAMYYENIEFIYSKIQNTLSKSSYNEGLEKDTMTFFIENLEEVVKDYEELVPKGYYTSTKEIKNLENSGKYFKELGGIIYHSYKYLLEILKGTIIEIEDKDYYKKVKVDYKYVSDFFKIPTTLYDYEDETKSMDISYFIVNNKIDRKDLLCYLQDKSILSIKEEDIKDFIDYLLLYKVNVKSYSKINILSGHIDNNEAKTLTKEQFLEREDVKWSMENLHKGKKYIGNICPYCKKGRLSNNFSRVGCTNIYCYLGYEPHWTDELVKGLPVVTDRRINIVSQNNVVSGEDFYEISLKKEGETVCLIKYTGVDYTKEIVLDESKKEDIELKVWLNKEGKLILKGKDEDYYPLETLEVYLEVISELYTSNHLKEWMPYLKIK